MFTSNEELFQATRDLIDSLERNGYGAEADVLKDGFSSLNGLTDGWALLLDAVHEVDRKSASVISDSEQEVLSKIHDAVYQTVYRRKRKAWLKFW